MPRLMADVCQMIAVLHEFLLFAVSSHRRSTADRLLEVRVNRRLLLGVEPFQWNGACTVDTLRRDGKVSVTH